MTVEMPAWIFALIILAAIFTTALIAYAAGKSITLASNAAHSECLDCTHTTRHAPLAEAQAAAKAHHAATGHLALVVAG